MGKCPFSYMKLARLGKCFYLSIYFVCFKREISRFVENGFPIFRFRCWPDVAWRAVQTSQVGPKISQQVTAIRIKVTDCNPPAGRSPEIVFGNIKPIYFIGHYRAA